MKLIVGLGNPGKRYGLTRHNVGFLVIKGIAKDEHIRLHMKLSFKAVIGDGMFGERRVTLAMPQTFMNLSGNSVRLIIKGLKVDTKDILVIIDDIALPFGSIRIRGKGSDGGHKGLRSVKDCLWTDEFARMRIGIAGTSSKDDISEYVLDKFTKKERLLMPDILSRAKEACECWVKEGIDVVMNRYNSMGE